MSIEKVRNYNQKILAVLSTLGVLFLLVCTVILIIEIWPSSRYVERPQGLISDEKAEALNQENLRKQIISYEMPWLIDTLKSTYIVPVSISTLEKAEVISYAEGGVLGLLDEFPSAVKREKGYYSHKHFDGKYANLIIYNPVEEKTVSLFNERIIIGNIQTYYFRDDILIVFYTASRDTDKNGIIDLSDHRNLCVYSLNTEVMRNVSDGDNQVMGYSFVENSKDLLVEFQLNQYKENQFSNHRSPGKIVKYSFDSQQQTNIIPESIQNGMQQLVEGK